MIMKLGIVVSPHITARECIFEVLEELSIDSHYIFEVTMKGTVLHHDDFAITLDNLCLYFTDFFI